MNYRERCISHDRLQQKGIYKNPLARATALLARGSSLFGDDVDEFAGDDDDLGDGEAGGVFPDLGGFAGGGFEGGAVEAGGEGDFAAHLAVDLEDDLEGVFFEGVGVDGGPAGVEDGARRVSTPNRLRGKTSPDSIAEQYK